MKLMVSLITDNYFMLFQFKKIMKSKEEKWKKVRREKEVEKKVSEKRKEKKRIRSR